MAKDDLNNVDSLCNNISCVVGIGVEKLRTEHQSVATRQSVSGGREEVHVNAQGAQ